jgi:glutaredoxin
MISRFSLSSLFLLSIVFIVSGYLSPSNHLPFLSFHRVTHVPSSVISRKEKQISARSRLFALKDEVEQLIKENKCMIFSKAYCPYCKEAKWAITNAGMSYRAMELDVSLLSGFCCSVFILVPYLFISA